VVFTGGEELRELGTVHKGLEDGVEGVPVFAAEDTSELGVPAVLEGVHRGADLAAASP